MHLLYDVHSLENGEPAIFDWGRPHNYFDASRNCRPCALTYTSAHNESSSNTDWRNLSGPLNPQSSYSEATYKQQSASVNVDDRCRHSAWRRLIQWIGIGLYRTVSGTPLRK